MLKIGQRMHRLAEELYPICRSITGDGVRETLCMVAREIPLTVTNVATGTPVFDWEVPKEWNIRDAWIKNAAGERVVDFRQSNLHVLGYSVPVRAKMPLSELRPHLFSLPNQPDLIPYRTSYYKENWGFCLRHRDLERLPEGEYEVCIEATLGPGHLTFAECYLPGKSSEEFLLSCHICHPSLANDNLAGLSVAVALAQELGAWAGREWSYRFLFIPGTIGSITWLALNEEAALRIRHGLVLTCLGDAGAMTYKKSRQGNALIDRAAEHVLKLNGAPHKLLEFYPYGYDERQYCSPGFNLPVGCISRSQHGTFPEYHTSGDNLDFIRPEKLEDSFSNIKKIIQVVEYNGRFLNLKPKCEPRLGKYGLYGTTGGTRTQAFDEMALLWVLNQSDGQVDLLSVAERSGISFEKIRAAAEALLAAGLLKRT